MEVIYLDIGRIFVGFIYSYLEFFLELVFYFIGIFGELLKGLGFFQFGFVVYEGFFEFGLAVKDLVSFVLNGIIVIVFFIDQQVSEGLQGLDFFLL